MRAVTRGLVVMVAVSLLFGCSKKSYVTNVTNVGSTGVILGTFTSISGPPVGVTITTDPVTVTTHLDSHGEFRINNVPAPAVYHVMTSGEPFVPETLSVLVESGQGGAVYGYLQRRDTLQILHTAATGGGANDIAVLDSAAYLATQAGLEVRDLHLAHFGRLIGRVDIYSSYDRALALAGTHVYYCGFNSQFSVVDVSNPAAPIVQKTIDTGGGAHDAEVDGQLLGVAANDSAIFYDLADPANPVRQGAVAVARDGLGQGCYGIALDPVHKLAIVSSFNNGLEIVGYSDPTHPVYLNQLASGLNPWDATLDPAHSRAFVAGDDGVLVVDYADPLQLNVLSQVTPGGNGGHDALLIGTQLLFASTFNGLYFLDVANPSAPVLRSRLYSEGYGSASGIAQSGGIAYVAARDRMYSAAPPAAPADLAPRAGTAAAGAAFGTALRRSPSHPVRLAHGGVRPLDRVPSLRAGRR